MKSRSVPPDVVWAEHLKRQIAWKRSEIGSLKGHLANAEAQLEQLREALRQAAHRGQAQ